MTDDLWKTSLHTIKSQLEKLSTKGVGPGCVYGVFSLEPIRRQRDIRRWSDFKEVEKFRLFSKGRLGSIFPSPVALSETSRSFTTLYPFSFRDKDENGDINFQGEYDELEREYDSCAASLRRLILGEKSEAERILGINDQGDLQVRDIWSVVLFRLASSPIEGSGLHPNNVPGSSDTFATLWQMVPEGENLCDEIAVPDSSNSLTFLFPRIYRGSVWILKEVVGSLYSNLQQDSPKQECRECLVRFDPPLVLYGTSHSKKPRPLDFPPLLYCTWSGQQEPYSTVRGVTEFFLRRRVKIF